MRTVEIAVIGAGPAGIGAALAAAHNGAGVVLIDENAAPGGHLRWMMRRQSGFGQPLDGLRGPEVAAWAGGELAGAGVEVLPNTIAWGLFEGNILGVASDTASFQLQAVSVILATGTTDIAWPFPGWELPGVMTATAALRMMHLDRILPGRQVAIVGSGQLADDVAADLGACGATVTLRLPTVDGAVAGGSATVEWIDVGGEQTACDAIVLAIGCQPDPQLALQAQVAIEFSTRDDVFVPTRTATMLTSVQNVYIAGGAAGCGSAAQAFAEGTVAGEAAMGGDGLASALERIAALKGTPAHNARMPAIAGDTLVCRCEEVRADVIRNAIDAGAITLNDIKRRTRAGMGICQGVYCSRTLAGMLSKESTIARELIVPMTARPPARLISMASMADLER